MLFLELLKYRQAARLGKGKKLFRSIIVCFFLFFLVQFSRSLPVFGFVRQVGLFSESPDTGCLQSPLTAQAVLAHHVCRRGCGFQQGLERLWLK